MGEGVYLRSTEVKIVSEEYFFFLSKFFLGSHSKFRIIFLSGKYGNIEPLSGVVVRNATNKGGERHFQELW